MATVTQIGLDIGSTGIRAVETRRGKAGPVLMTVGQMPLPAGAVQGGVIHDDKTVTLALKQLWATTKFRGKVVVLGVTNRQVVVREVAVTNLPERELRKALPFQVRQMLPLPVERSLLDFYPLEEPGTAGAGPVSTAKTIRGLLIAAPKEAVLTAVQATERAGLHVSRVDLASFALLRSSSRLDALGEAIVDIGAHAMTVVIHVDGVPLIVRTVPRGGAEITETIAKRLELGPVEAEALKCRVGLTADADTEAGGTAPGAVEVIREAVRPLVSEIRSSFAYLTASDQQTRVARLVLSGGGSLLPGLGALLGTTLGVEWSLADPSLRLRSHRGTDGDRFHPSAAVSIGLALGAAG